MRAVSYRLLATGRFFHTTSLFKVNYGRRCKRRVRIIALRRSRPLHKRGGLQSAPCPGFAGIFRIAVFGSHGSAGAGRWRTRYRKVADPADFLEVAEIVEALPRSRRTRGRSRGHGEAPVILRHRPVLRASAFVISGERILVALEVHRERNTAHRPMDPDAAAEAELDAPFAHRALALAGELGGNRKRYGLEVVVGARCSPFSSGLKEIKRVVKRVSLGRCPGVSLALHSLQGGSK
jgi:hypothetical protein